MLLWVIRGLFVLVWAGIAGYLAWRFEMGPWVGFGTFAGVLGLGVVVVGVDVAFKRKKIAVIFAVFVGLVVGMILSNLIMVALVPFLQALEHNLPASVPAEIRAARPIEASVNLVVTSIMCYLGVSLLLQTRDDFRFIVPYTEFSKEVKGNRPLVLDTSVIIDGRIADLVEARVFDTTLVVPNFVLHELQVIADSSDKLRRNRGRRGLDVLNRMRNSPGVNLQMHDAELRELKGIQDVDQRLVLLARHLGGKVVTNDFNLNKLSKVQGVDVVNLNDMANALKPVVLPGESLTVRLTKPGDQPGQGVGYLEDGTMVVAEQGRNYIGEEVALVVTSVLQTSAGRMIFGRFDSRQPSPAESGGGAPEGEESGGRAGVGARIGPGAGRPRHP